MAMFNLRVHTDNTFLSSTITVSKLIQYTLKYRFPAAAICDVQNMHGVAEFYHLCLKNQIKPIIGVEFYVSFDEEMTIPLLLFAKNAFGYQQLVQLTSLVNQYQVRTLDKKYLKMYSQHLICVIPSDQPYFIENIKEQAFLKLNSWLESLKAIYSDLYFGIYRYKHCDETYLQTFKEWGMQQNVFSLAMQNAFHLSSKDTIIVNLLDCIKNQTKANKDFLNHPAMVEAYLKDEHDLKVMYDEDERKQLQKMMHQIDVSIPHLPFALPSTLKDKKQTIDLLASQCQKRLLELNLNTIEYQTRLQNELQVIDQMGFVDYFFIVADYVHYAKTHDIMVGPGRGSAGSSLVAYLLEITSIDPIQYHLIFERFLNVARVSMPDIDIDFLDVKRDQVIAYLKEKYGYRHVSQIGTFSTLGPKSAIRDMARVLSMNTDEVDYLLSFYPKKEDLSITQAYKQVEAFKDIVDRHQKYKQLIALASQIEGLKRQSGIHAAGVVLYKDPIDAAVPTIQINENTLVTQYDYKQIEKLGLVKMDLLGLKNLTIIDACLHLIQQETHQNYTLDTFPYDQKEVYDFLATGNTMGIFQLESAGMKRTIQELKPTCFEDIVSLLAIYRPGPMKNIHSFIARKHHQEPITYLHEDLKEILEPTYGIIVYQEQIMQIVQKIANYTYSEADLFRRAIGKKDSQELQRQKERFIQSCVANHYPMDFAIALFALIEKFADYGFNRAHSVGYAKIAMVMAAIKVFYPAIFYKTLLEMNADSDQKKLLLLQEAQYFHIQLDFPSVNDSALHYTIQNNRLRVGLGEIATIKATMANQILEERKEGLFLDIYDFMIRMIKRNLSMAQFEALVYSGALDCFKIKRPLLIANQQNLFEYGNMFIDLPYQIHDYQSYDYLPIPLLKQQEIQIDWLAKEKEYLGFYLSVHPIKKIKEKINLPFVDIVHLSNEKQKVSILGKINKIEFKKNKSGKDMLVVQLEDDTGNVTLYGFSPTILNLRDQLFKKDLVVVDVDVQSKTFILIQKMQKIGGKET